MNDQRILENGRHALKESVDFFSSRNKGAIERWACTEFLMNIGLGFEIDEVISQKDDPPDVIFRGAQYEVKQILDPGRRRHDEYKEALSKAHAATDLAEFRDALSTQVTPEDITPLEISSLISVELAKLVSEYEPRFRRTLNLLFYVNLMRHTLKVGPMPDPEAFTKCGWRSISVLIGWGSLVFFAGSNAPDFLRAKVGALTLRRFGTGTVGI